MNLTAIYTKTAEGLRIRKSLFGGLSAQNKRVIDLVDGHDSVQAIVQNLTDMPEQKVIAALTQLEKDGYIKWLADATKEDEWELGTVFSPMLVEEIEVMEELDFPADLAPSQFAEIAEANRLEDERKAKEIEKQIRIREKAKAESEEKARLDAQRIAQAAIEKEAIEKQARAKATLEAKIKAEVEQQARLLAEQKAREEAEKVKEEDERLEREALAIAEAEAKVVAETNAKLEAEAKIQAEANEKARLDAERVAREVAEMQRLADEQAAKIKAEEEAKAYEESMRVAQLQAIREAEERANAEAANIANELKLKQEAEDKVRIEAERAALESEEKQRKAEETLHKAELEAQALVERIRAKEKARREQVLQARAEEAAKKAAEAEAKAAEQARLLSEKQAKKEAEAQAKALAEEKAIAEAKERGRQEAERIAKEAEEARQKTEAAEAKAAAQAKALEQESENARLEAERIAQDEQREAQEKQRQLEAQVIASEAARKEAELAAQTKAAEEARLAIELEEKLAAEAKVAAQAKALEQERENARLETERIAQEAQREAEEKQRLEAQAMAAEEARITQAKEAEAREQAKEQARLEKALIAQEKADDKARQKEAEKARKEAERNAKKAQEEAKAAEKQAKKQAELAAKQAKVSDAFSSSAQAEDTDEGILDWKIIQAQDKRKAARKPFKMPAFIKTIIAPSNIKKWVKSLVKFTFVYVPILALVLLGLMHIVPLSMLNQPIEKLASASVGAPVKVGEVRASLWPQPHFVLNNVVMGEGVALNIATVNVVPRLATLFEENKVVSSVTFEDVVIEQKNFGLPALWLRNAGKSTQVNIEAFNFKKVKLSIRDYALGTFDGNIKRNAENTFSTMTLKSVDQPISAEIMQIGEQYQVQINASKWALLGSKVVLDEVNARGIYLDKQLNFSQVSGEIYGGKFNATAALNWTDAWRAEADFDLSKANTDDLLKAFASTGSVAGKLNLNGNLRSQAASVAGLAGAANMTARFEIPNGKINGVDIAHAIVTPSDKSLEGYNTPFDKLAGNVQLSNGQFHYKNLLLHGDKLRAQGSVDINEKQQISGKIYASLFARSRSFNETFDLTNTVGNVKRK